MLKTTRFVSAFTALFLLLSCNKIDELKAEASTLEAKRELLNKEMAVYKERTRTLNQNGMVSRAPTILNSARADLANAERRAAEAKEKLAKWETAESTLNSLKEKVAAYKAKHLK